MEFIGRHRFVWFWLFLVSVCSLVDIPQSPVFGIPLWGQIVYVTLVGCFKALVLLSLAYPLLTRRKLLPLFRILFGLYTLLALVNVVSSGLYGMGITRKLILIFAQTTPDETAGFLPGLIDNILSFFSTTTPYLILLFILLSFFALRHISSRAAALCAIVPSLAGAALCIVFCTSFSSDRSAHLLSARIVKYGREVLNGNREYEEMLAHRKPLPYRESVSSLHLADEVIVVIGESAHRNHHSLYGYPLPTTPSLDSLASNLFIFSDAIGSSMATAGNMERILSFKEDDDSFGDGLEYPLVIDLFNAMDYHTYWLSNQERTGSVSNTSGVMAMNADVIRYVGADNSEDVLSLRYDGALLPYLDMVLEDKERYKLIFLHLLGSHVEYKSRYPKEYGVFSADDEFSTFHFSWLDQKKAARRAEYDNSIHYTDSLLGQIIGRASLSSRPSLVIYFSDHGEEVYDNSSFSGRNENTVQVPFIIYANPAYLARNPQKADELKKAVDRPLSTANFVHILINLTGGSYFCYDPALDALSDQFRVRPRHVDEHIWVGDTPLSAR